MKIREGSSLLLWLAIAFFSGPNLTAKCQQYVTQVATNSTKGEIININNNNLTSNGLPSVKQADLADETDASGARLPLVEPLTERLVKQSNLQAEESRQEASVSIVPPPPPQSNVESRGDKPKARSQTSFHGGSGNSYMSISHDGSNRYEFGYDTKQAAALEPQQAAPKDTSPAVKVPRLMREESRLEDGTVIGRYGYTDPFNVFRIVQYVAGADGYFASEHVGALVDESPMRGGKFQLNKQLHKALEQVRARRNKGSTQADNQQQYQQAKPAPKQPSGGSADLSTSASQPVRYSTTINHLVGSNGVSYATAFRPVAAPSLQTSRLARLASNIYEPVRSPNPVEALQRQHASYEQLRSKLPAPIYTPNSYSFAIAHSAVPAEPQEPTSPQADHWGPARVNQPKFSPDVLQASPAWNVLNNNYNSDQHHQLSLLIDHQQGTEISAPLATLGSALGAQINENFNREAEILKSVQKRQQHVSRREPAASGTNFGMAYNYNDNHQQQPHQLQQPQPQQQQQHYQQHQVSKPASQAIPVFGARTSGNGQWQQHYGLALDQFNPPLYHPDVHDQTSSLDSTEPQVSVYASTVVHSELAAEQDYKPERRPHVASEDDTLWRSSSEPKLAVSNLNSSAKNATKQILQPTIIHVNEPVRYATRLTNLVDRSALEESDMLMEQSETSAVYSANGTSSSRAKLPDRSKKLSSIFKARTAHVADDSDTSSGSGPKIRRPVPVNMKKQPQFKSQKVESTHVEQNSQVEVARAAQVIIQATEAANSQQEPSNKVNASKTFSSKRFGNPVAKNSDYTVEPQEPSALPVAAKKRPILRPEPVSIEPISSYKTPNSTSTTTSAPPVLSSTVPIERIIAVTTLTPLVSSNPNEDPDRVGRPVATILDASGQSSIEMRPSLNKELYEKIVRIQQEIAAKSLTASITTTLRPSSTETTQRPDTVARTPTTSRTPASSITTTLKPTAASVQILPEPIVTTVLPLSNASKSEAVPTDEPQAIETTSSSSSTFKRLDSVSKQQTTNQGFADNTVGERAITTEQATNNDKPVPAKREFLTGPVIAMSDPNMDGVDFLTKLDLELNSDSLRDLQTSEATRLKGSKLATTTASPLITTTTTTTTPEPIVDRGQDISSTAVKPDAGLNLTADSVLIASSVTDSERSVVPTATLSTTTTTTSTTTNAPTISSVYTTTARPIEMNSTLAQPQSTSANETNTNPKINPTTTTPSSVVSEQSVGNTTSEHLTRDKQTTVAPTVQQVSTKRPAKGSTLPARFGRLVIKRGDKVVARFNASESIPDSVIPVGNGNGGIGSEGIIMPDMPRLAMRRSFKKRVQPQAEIWSPNRQIDRLPNTNTSAPSSNSSTTVSPLTGTEQKRFRKSLFREPRSSKIADEMTDDLLSSETSPEIHQLETVEKDKQTPSVVPAAGKIVRLKARNSWSARLIDSAGMPTANEKYDPEEDLRKLVEKISAIERSSARTSSQQSRLPTATTV